MTSYSFSNFRIFQSSLHFCFIYCNNMLTAWLLLFGVAEKTKSL